MLWNSRGGKQRMSLQKCANFSDCGPISACATDTRIQPEYPVLFSMFSGEFCLRLKPYLVVKIAPMYWLNIAVKYAFWLWCFAAPTAGCVLACVVSDCPIRETPRTSVPRVLACWHSDRPTWDMKNIHLIFTFYLNRDTSVLELFPVIVFQ